MQKSETEDARVETIAAATIYLMTHYSRTGCPRLAMCVSRHLQCLASHPDAPPVLYVRGRVDCLREPQLAMVGSRNPSSGGRAIARRFAGHFARLGLCITSGLALGIDAASHEGALGGGGSTVAELAHGLDEVYPREHHDLADRIAAAGALVSEFPPGVAPLNHHFPRRNRIIAGLSQGTVVIEAAHQCMTTRGVHKTGVTMVTSTMLGDFRRNSDTRREFLAVIGNPGSREDR